MIKVVNTRELVLDILLDVTKQGGYSHIAAASVLEKHQYLDKKDRAFITRMTEGTLEKMIQLDYIIDQFSKVPVRKMKPVICCILRSGIYQILYMDAVPDAAACNEAVRLAKKKGFRSLSGFVNGILRNISRSKDRIVFPDKEKEPEAYLSICYSIPKWMIRMWLEESGCHLENKEDQKRMEQLLEVFSSPAPLTIRTNTDRCTPQELLQKLNAEGVSAVCSKELPYAIHITGCDHLAALPSFREGLFYIQDISSMLAAETAAPKEHDFVLDVCAAPGGKAIHIAQLMHGTGHVLARDLTQYKVNLLQENMQRCQVTNMETQVWDARILDESYREKADLVIADLPCSGLGVMRRKKDICYKMTLEKIRELAALQREILAVIHHYVKPGARMIYSTCTISRRENEENTRWFLNNHKEFTLLSSRQIFPAMEGGDGFYIAEFRKNS